MFDYKPETRSMRAPRPAGAAPALRPVPTTDDLATLLAPIEADMKAVNALIRSRLQSEVALIDEIGHYIVNAGGKRLRPALLLLVAGALDAPAELARLLATVIEFIHTATLLHDDVVDHADLRRGRRTANALWGNAGAVLSGDFLYSRSFQLMVEAGRMDVMRVMADATNAIAEGEVLQLLNAHDPEVDESRYLRVIELKTGRLFEAAAMLGALCAGAGPQQVARMQQAGRDFGIAYQLVDDLLDYVGDSDHIGKAVGADLAEGKPTLPLIHAMRRGTPEQSQLIRDAIRGGDASRWPELIAAVDAVDAIPYTRALAQRYCESARQALGDLPESRFRGALLALADFVTERSR
jgi:Geranylgeranyl pyrophosphate synthase